MTFKKSLIFTTAFLALLFVLASCAPAPKTQALSGSAFSAGRIMDDGVFFRVNTMGISDIQDFLNSKVPSCDTNGDKIYSGSTTRRDYSATKGYYPPFTCLKDYRQDTIAKPSEPGLCNGFSAGNKSSAQIIYEVAQSCSVNPKVLLVLLQKEQSLITDDWPWSIQYRSATGYGCPDTADCDSAYYGFFNQVYSAARQFKNYSLRSDQFNFQARRNNNISFNPSSSCGSSSVYVENQATAGLYNYTPYQPNQAALNNLYGSGDACSAYGNRNFWRMYNDWFGGTWTNEEGYLFITSSASSLNYNPSGSGTVSITIKNIGFNSWYSDHNLPAGKQPTRLAMVGYQDSPFADTSDPNWLGTRNQIRMSPDVVAPGDTATFTFQVVAPYQVMAFEHHLVPIVGGLFLRDVGINIRLTSNVPAWNPLNTTDDGRDLWPNQQSHFVATVQNNSGSSWYSDNNLPAGKQPTRLASVGYQNSPFADTNDPNWLGTRNQIKMTPDVVAPGQTATFSAWFIAPISSTPVNAPFHFVVVEGGIFTEDKGLIIPFKTQAANLSYEGVSASNPPATMSPGQTASGVTYTIKNTGNIVWHDETYQSGAHALRLVMNTPVYRLSSFYNSADTTWLSPGQIAKPTGTTWPGGTTTFTFTWKAPMQTGTYQDPFQLVVGGHFLNNYGARFDTRVQ